MVLEGVTSELRHPLCVSSWLRTRPWGRHFSDDLLKERAPRVWR